MPRVDPLLAEHAAARHALMDQLHHDRWTVVGWWNGFGDRQHAIGIDGSALGRAIDQDDVIVMHRSVPSGGPLLRRVFTIEARIAGPHWRRWIKKGGIK